MQKLSPQKEDLDCLRNLLQSSKPFVIEFSNNKDKDESSFIQICLDFFNGNGYKMKVLDSRACSGKYEKDYIKERKGLSLSDRNLLVTYEITSNLLSELSDGQEIIILDEVLFDRLIWLQRLISSKAITEEEFKRYVTFYLPQINNLINCTIISYSRTFSETPEYSSDASQNIDNEVAMICCQHLLNGRNLLSDSDEENKLSYRVLENLLPIMKSDYIKQLKLMLEKKGQE